MTYPQGVLNLNWRKVKTFWRYLLLVTGYLEWAVFELTIN